MVAAAVERKIVAGGGQFAGNAHNLGRPTGAPWKQCHLWFFSVWLGLNAILHFSDTTPQAAAVGADVSTFDSFDILMRRRCFGGALLSPFAWSFAWWPDETFLPEVVEAHKGSPFADVLFCLELYTGSQVKFSAFLPGRWVLESD